MIKHSRSVVATALLASAIVVAGGLQASAHNPPGDKTNAITANALTSNALTSNGWQTNALTANIVANAVKICWRRDIFVTALTMTKNPLNLNVYL